MHAGVGGLLSQRATAFPRASSASPSRLHEFWYNQEVRALARNRLITSDLRKRRGGRVVEGTRLESGRTRKGTASSNLALSARPSLSGYSQHKQLRCNDLRSPGPTTRGPIFVAPYGAALDKANLPQRATVRPMLSGCAGQCQRVPGLYAAMHEAIPCPCCSRAPPSYSH